MKLQIAPITVKQAKAFVQDHHRHHEPPPGCRWAIALMRGDELVGVAMAGNPVNRWMRQQGWLEITRVCVIPGVLGGSSMLYTRCKRIGQLMGYRKFRSSTDPSESGASLRAAGFADKGITKGGTWSRKRRPRRDKHSTGPKRRWESVPPCPE